MLFIQFVYEIPLITIVLYSNIDVMSGQPNKIVIQSGFSLLSFMPCFVKMTVYMCGLVCVGSPEKY